MRLDFDEAARADLDDVWDHGAATWGPSRANAYVRRLRDVAEGLASGRRVGTRAEDVAPGLWRRPCGSHVIWFRRAGDSVTVVRILHQRRDAPRHLGRG